MKRLISFCFLLAVAALATGADVKPRPEIMGVALGMGRDESQARLKSIGSMDQPERKRQEVWAIGDPRISHLIVGYDAEYRVRYVTALARPNGPRISYQEVAGLQNGRLLNNQGHYTLTREIGERPGQFAYVMIAHGRDPQYLDSYSIKRVKEEEID